MAFCCDAQRAGSAEQALAAAQHRVAAQEEHQFRGSEEAAAMLEQVESKCAHHHPLLILHIRQIDLEMKTLLRQSWHIYLACVPGTWC